MVLLLQAVPKPAEQTMDPGLVKSLGHFFGIHVLLACLDLDGGVPWLQGDHLSVNFPWQMTHLPPEVISSSGSYLLHGGKVLVACQDVNFSTLQLNKGELGADVVWLAPSTPDTMSAAEQLPLNLNSNLLLYTDGGHQNVSISEAYAVKSHFRTKSFGTWSRNGGLAVPEPAKWERRKDLTGIVLVDSMLEWVPMNFWESDERASGFFPDILFELQDTLNFRYKGFCFFNLMNTYSNFLVNTAKNCASTITVLYTMLQV